MPEPETEKSREITTEYVSLSDRAEELHDRLGILLDERLTPVMRGEEPKQPEGVNPQKGYGCQLARELETITDKLAKDIRKINDALARLEL